MSYNSVGGSTNPYADDNMSSSSGSFDLGLDLLRGAGAVASERATKVDLMVLMALDDEKRCFDSGDDVVSCCRACPEVDDDMVVDGVGAAFGGWLAHSAEFRNGTRGELRLYWLERTVLGSEREVVELEGMLDLGSADIGD